MIDHLANGSACSRSASLLAVASGQADLGQPLQGVRPPADEPMTWCRSTDSCSSSAASSRSPFKSAASPMSAEAKATAEGSAAQSRGPQARAVSITSS